VYCVSGILPKELQKAQDKKNGENNRTKTRIIRSIQKMMLSQSKLNKDKRSEVLSFIQKQLRIRTNSKEPVKLMAAMSHERRDLGEISEPSYPQVSHD